MRLALWNSIAAVALNPRTSHFVADNLKRASRDLR
jgi:hypothetical protein